MRYYAIIHLYRIVLRNHTVHSAGTWQTSGGGVKCDEKLMKLLNLPHSFDKKTKIIATTAWIRSTFISAYLLRYSNPAVRYFPFVSHFLQQITAENVTWQLFYHYSHIFSESRITVLIVWTFICKLPSLVIIVFSTVYWNYCYGP